MTREQPDTAADVLIDLRAHSWRTWLLIAAGLVVAGVALALIDPLAPLALVALALFVSESARAVAGWVLALLVVIVLGVAAVTSMIDDALGDDEVPALEHRRSTDD